LQLFAFDIPTVSPVGLSKISSPDRKRNQMMGNPPRDARMAMKRHMKLLELMGFSPFMFPVMCSMAEGWMTDRGFGVLIGLIVGLAASFGSIMGVRLFPRWLRRHQELSAARSGAISIGVSWLLCVVFWHGYSARMSSQCGSPIWSFAVLAANKIAMASFLASGAKIGLGRIATWVQCHSSAKASDQVFETWRHAGG
jgi:hypothetical protein